MCNILLQFVKFTDFTDSRVLHVTVGSSVAFTAVNILIEVMVVVVVVVVVVVTMGGGGTADAGAVAGGGGGGGGGSTWCW